MKKKIDYLQASSLSELLDLLNWYNEHEDIPILKDDIVQIFNDGGTYILLYYK